MKRFLTILFSLAMICSMLAAPGQTVQARARMDWKQVNAAPNPPMATITAMIKFKDMLYAGTSIIYPIVDGAPQAAIYRSKDGTRWEKVTQDGFGDTVNNIQIWALTVFKGKLYAGAGGFGEYDPLFYRHVQIWRTSDGVTWEAVTTDGFGAQDNLWVDNLFVFDGMIYSIGTGMYVGFQIYRSPSGDPGTWTKTTNQFDKPPAPFFSFGVTTFKGKLYLAAIGDLGALIYSSANGIDWVDTNVANFGVTDAAFILSGGLSVFDGYLYSGLGPPSSGGQIWRTRDGKNWNQVMAGGFGDKNNVNITGLIPFDGDLYAVTSNDATGMEVWSSHNGKDWQQVNQDGFSGQCSHDGAGNLANCNSTGGWWYGTPGALDFGKSLYLGSYNPAGGQIWRLSASKH